MQTFSPAGSKVDLVEAAEAHAQQLDQLAHNLSRCVAQWGKSQAHLGMQPDLPGGSQAFLSCRKQQEGHAWWAEGSPGCPLTPTSIIVGVNQDRFIQRAVEASNAYSSILQAVQAAEGAAGQAQQQASRAWEVGPSPPTQLSRRP